MFWTVKVKGRVWDDGDDGDGKEVTVGGAELYIVPDAGIIDLFLTLDAVNQEVAKVGEMLTVNRPDLIHEMSLGGDLLILSWLKVAPGFRGNKLGHSMLKAVLSSMGRSSTKVILEATPPLTDNGLMEGSPEYLAGKAALRRYWESFGFQPRTATTWSSTTCPTPSTEPCHHTPPRPGLDVPTPQPDTQFHKSNGGRRP